MGIFDFLKRDQNPKTIKKRNYGGARGGRLFGEGFRWVFLIF